MKSKETPPFAPTLMESTRAIGYSLEAAIADIVDNSIAAKSGKVQISFFPIGDAYVCILDDGAGMDAAAIDTAMQYGSRSPAAAAAKRNLPPAAQWQAPGQPQLPGSKGRHRADDA